MKNFYIYLFLFISVYFSAQQTLFQKSLNENNLSSTQKLNSLMSKNYYSTSYFSEKIENLAQNLNIRLPNGKNISAVFQKDFHYPNKSSSATYQIVNEPHAELVFSEYNNVVTGMYVSAQGDKIIIQEVAPTIFAISSINEQMLINQDNYDDTVVLPTEPFTTQKTLAHPTVCSGTVCPNSTIDVMILYTPEAKDAYGGTSQSNSFAATAITNFNNALQNAGVSNVTINLVHAGEISYEESGNISTDLTRLRTPGDGFMDDAQSLRTLYGADIVALITSTPTNTCGLGNLNSNPTNYSSNAAYSVTIFSCVVSNYSLSHEIGHNMGLNHDWYVNTNNNPCSHHHGYINRTAITEGTASPTSARWRTIMAYNNECSELGFNCSRRNLWSNPQVNYNAEPTGIAIGNPNPSHESYGFARFACVVSEFMPTATLSTKNTIIEDFTVYPNPVKDQLNINFSKNGNYIFNIINAAGQKLLTTKDNSISVRDYASGLYYLAVYDEDKQLIGTKKFVVK